MSDFTPRLRPRPALPRRRAVMWQQRLMLPPKPHRPTGLAMTLADYLDFELTGRVRSFGARLAAKNNLNAGSQRVPRGEAISSLPQSHVAATDPRRSSLSPS